MPRPAYAPTSRYWDGYQSESTAGLTYFPDNMTHPSPLGNIVDDLAMAGGTAIAGPAGGIVGGATSSVIQRWFGGSAVDQQRQERVNYVAQYAVNGNVPAMRLILGAPSNVSGNERTMWERAYDLIKQQNPQVVRDAEAIGPAWLVNSGDTATNYPRMREFIRAGESVIQQAAGTITDFFSPPGSSAPSGAVMPGAAVPRSGGMSPLMLGGIALAAVVVLSRRRS